jgi:hypothetical protein
LLRAPRRVRECPPTAWEAFARLVLEAAYEATLLAAVEQSSAGGPNIVLLTRVGGGAFGNADEWIDDAIVRALAIVALNLCLDAGPAGAWVMPVISLAAAGPLCENARLIATFQRPDAAGRGECTVSAC